MPTEWYLTHSSVDPTVYNPSVQENGVRGQELEAGSAVAMGFVRL